MKLKYLVFLWGLVQLGLGFAVKYLSGIYDLKSVYLWIGVLNIVVWIFIGMASYRMVKEKELDELVLSGLAANFVGIIAFMIVFFDLMKKTSVQVFSQHYFLPMRTLAGKLLNQNTLSMLSMDLDKIFMLALLIHFTAFGVGYLVGKK